ncbi:MAG: hypothetical protein KJ697_01750 [Nanoarchaeota archaeon]|nr:hypothetical protein [Nanoarchaeota archaeon]MBU4124538.1 hypothetical protein [Nanoarchaeota archaeon]
MTRYNPVPKDRRKVGTTISVVEELEKLKPDKLKPYEAKAAVLVATGLGFRKPITVYGKTYYDGSEPLEDATDILNTEGKSDGYKVW